MANIYITDEVQKELDDSLRDYNDKNATTDRSGYISFLVNYYKEYKKK